LRRRWKPREDDKKRFIVRKEYVINEEKVKRSEEPIQEDISASIAGSFLMVMFTRSVEWNVLRAFKESTTGQRDCKRTRITRFGIRMHKTMAGK
jgi:hypothetical protein